jgi:hypothetical protein
VFVTPPSLPVGVFVVTESVIKPVTLPATSLARHGCATGLSANRYPLPVPSIPTPRTNVAVYGLAAVDRRGRIADRTIVQALSWHPSARLDIREARGLLLVHADPNGVFSVANQGPLRLPSSVRHHCCLLPGDRAGELAWHGSAADLVATPVKRIVGADRHYDHVFDGVF